MTQKNAQQKQVTNHNTKNRQSTIYNAKINIPNQHIQQKKIIRTKKTIRPVKKHRSIKKKVNTVSITHKRKTNRRNRTKQNNTQKNNINPVYGGKSYNSVYKIPASLLNNTDFNNTPFYYINLERSKKEKKNFLK